MYTYVSLVNTTEMSNLMKKKLNNVDCKPKRRELIDEIPIIRESAGLARKLLWREKVEKVVERESEKFKNKVFNVYHIFYQVTIIAQILFSGQV